MMKNLTRILLPAVIGALCMGAAAAAEITDSDDSITIYSSMQAGAVSPDLYRPVAGRTIGGQVPGYAIIRHDRNYDFEKGLHTLRVSDVAALIDPTTVTFSSLEHPDTRVLEQSFQFDLVSQAKLLQRYLGQRVTVEQPRGDHVDLVDGILLGAGDGLTLQLDDGSVQAIHSYGNIRFSQLPGGLITRPTLEWLLDSPVRGSQATRISYETRGMTWWTDYNVIYDESRDCTMDLSAWVSIINQSGASYADAKLKLIAGDVNRAEAGQPRREAVYAMAAAGDTVGFAEKSFFEYHLYTLGRRTSLPDNSTRQIQLMPAARGIHCEKELVFAPTLNTPYHGRQQFDREYGRHGDSKVNVYLRFANEKDHVLIEMGKAFDVVGERKQTDFRVDQASRNLWETFEIRLRNHKDEAIEVAVLENLYRSANWKIENASQGYGKETSNRIRFDVNVDSEGESVIRYTVHYSW
jgi:hypothetical protein